jgi:hypothetical protein
MIITRTGRGFLDEIICTLSGMRGLNKSYRPGDAVLHRRHRLGLIADWPLKLVDLAPQFLYLGLDHMTPVLRRPR